MIKRGDVVKRIMEVDRYAIAHGMDVGKNYVVDFASDNNGIVRLEGIFGTWDIDAFQLVSKQSKTSSLDIQHGGNHYKGLKIQPVEYIMANGIGYMEGNAIKYLTRYKLKNGTEDLKKAKHYIEMLIENEEKNNAESKAK